LPPTEDGSLLGRVSAPLGSTFESWPSRHIAES
jgi:hypothetical protein